MNAAAIEPDMLRMRIFLGLLFGRDDRRPIDEARIADARATAARVVAILRRPEAD